MKKLTESPHWAYIVENRNTLSLRQLAAVTGHTPNAIANALKREGITRYPAPCGPRKKSE